MKWKMKRTSRDSVQVTAHEEAEESRKLKMKTSSRNDERATTQKVSRTLTMRVKESHNSDQVIPHEEDLGTCREIPSDIEVAKNTHQTMRWKELENFFGSESVFLAFFLYSNTAALPRLFQ